MSNETLRKLNPLNNRKLYLILFIIAIGVAMAYLNKITGSEWVELVKWTTGFYIGGNVYQKVIKKK